MVTFATRKNVTQQLESFQKEIFSLQNTMILSPCNMSRGWWSALVPNVQTLASRTALADLCFLLWFNVLFIQFLFVFVYTYYKTLYRSSSTWQGNSWWSFSKELTSWMRLITNDSLIVRWDRILYLIWHAKSFWSVFCCQSAAQKWFSHC